MTTESMNTMKWPRNGSGATLETSRNSSAAPPMSPSLRPWLIGTFGGFATATGPDAVDAPDAPPADTCTGGGGHSTSPSRTTVIPRWTTSSRSSTSSPSLPGVSSLRRLTRLVTKSWEAWVGSRPGRSV